MTISAAVPTAANQNGDGPDVSDGSYTEAEQRAAQALDRRDPALGRSFRGWLPAAQARVLGRLWGAMWREPLPGVTDRRAHPDQQQATLVLDDGSRLVAPVASTEPFARYPTGLTVHRHAPDGRVRALHHPVELLTAARLPDRDGSLGRLSDELADSVANLAMALVAGQHRADGRYLDPGSDPLPFFEQAVLEGHPLHPCCRTRSGMTPEDLLDCAPEWAPVVSLPVLAVRRDHHSGRGDLTRLLCAEHPGLAAVARATLADPDRYALLPVHPWQLREVLLSRYADAFARGTLTVLPQVGIEAHPLMSLRTLAPVGVGAACHLKTAMDVQMTSAVRTVSSAAVHNGPVLSVLLAEIDRREGGWGGRFALLAEPASGCYVDPEHGPSASLAALAREPADRHLWPREIPVPVAALSARSPAGDAPLVIEAMRTVGVGAASWLDGYCRLLLPPLLTLLTRWGVALEAHGQNTLVVLRDGRPVRVLYRDLGGIRISPRRLARHGLTPVLRGDLPVDDPDELRTKLIASLVSTQLAELVAVLAEWTGTGRAALWGVVAAACRDACAELGGEPEAAADQRALLGDTLPTKAMLGMRLAAAPTADRWVFSPNPLAGVR
ncbi:MAG TPA: IucA/IucC family protein [Mycobacteriales bacterium]